VWCGLGNDSTIGNVVAALGTAVGTDCSRCTAPSTAAGPWQEYGHEELENRRLLDFVNRASGLSHAIVLGPDGEWGVTRCDDLRSKIPMARDRAAILGLATISENLAGAGMDAANLGYGYRSMLVADRTAWNYFAEVPDRPDHSLWLGLDRRQSQGMGWALLTSLLRQMAP
jgi:hypothetical protein